MKFNTTDLKFAFNKYTFPIRKRSPEILLISGIITIVGSAVMACRATTKLEAIQTETDEKLAAVDATLESQTPDVYSDEDAKKDKTVIYTRHIAKVTKLYSPWVLTAGLGIAAICASHGIMLNRQAALAAAYKAVDEGYKLYRKHVVDRFGEDVDTQLRYGIKAEEITATEVGEDGKKHKVKKTELTPDEDYANPSVYAKFFDELCPAWRDDSELNLVFLRARENEANYRLRAQGYLFLNDVYDMLSIPRTKAGQVVGWTYSHDDNADGDNRISFNIYNRNDQVGRDFVNGFEKSILLDFNVDGVIKDILPEF